MELPFFTTGSSSSATTRAEALRWLSIAEKLLSGRDLVGSKSFAGRVREFDPSLLYADQIIAVADTLLAGDKRINNQHDWYSVLQLTGHQTHDSELIASQYRKLALLLNPQKNKLPFADHAFNLVVNAWSVLSNPSRKSLYDNELMSHMGVNSVSSGFNPITTGVTREHVNFQPFEINFQQVMPQQQQQHQHQHHQQQPQGMIREQVTVTQPIPQHAMSREHVQLSQQLPHQNVNREPVNQQPMSHQNLAREQQVRQQPQLQPQPQPKPPQQQTQHQPQPQPQPQSHHRPHLQTQIPPQVQQHVQPQPQSQSQAQPQQPQQRKDYWMGGNVTHNFTGTFENSNANANANTNTAANNNNNDDDVSGNNNNASTENVENVENSEDREDERRLDDASDDGELTFWTACPYCYYMYEYPSVYAECALKCQTCKKAFQAVPLPSPPPIIDGQESYFCCWGLMPLGVSMDILERNKKPGNWTPFSPMFTCPRGFGRSGDTGNTNNFRGWNTNNVNDSGQRPMGNNAGVRKHSTPRVYVEEDDVFVAFSGSSEEPDDDWRNKKSSQKRKKTTKGGKRNSSATPSKNSRKFQVDKGKNVNGRDGGNVEVLQEGVEVSAASVAETSKKGAAVNTRRQSARVANFGKLDLNVEFSNETEEPVRRGNQGNGAARGEEDIIEGSGFFEGLDEFLSSLPILNVVGDDKVKAA